MYYAVIIDDEYYVLEGLKKMLPWAEYGFDVAAAFQNAREAFTFIKDNHPDAVFTDIRMPDMSGIELLEKCRENDINVPFIFISGYNDFEYVKKAIEQGAIDYFEKPVIIDETRQMFIRLREELRMQALKKEQYALELLEQSDGDSLKKLFRMYNISPDWPCWRIAQTSIPVDIINQCIKKIGCKAITLTIGANCNLSIFGGSEAMVETMTNTFCDSLSVSDYIGLSKIGVSDQIYSLLEQARLAFMRQFVEPGIHINEYVQFSDNTLIDMIVKIRSYIQQRDVKKCISIIQNWPELFKTNGWGVVQLEQLWNSIVVSFHEFIEAEVSDLECCSIDTLLEQYENMENLIKRLVAIINTHIEKKNIQFHLSNSQFENLINEVKINYHKNITLQYLSERYFLSSSYICELFKKNAGTTLSGYITDLRMNKAAELLTNGENLTQVAHMVGYNDYFYFSKVFKKRFGISPSQYIKLI